MNIDTIILQLKANCPSFAGNIAGAADYATGLETVVSLPLPAAFVYPLEDVASENQNMGWSLRQLVQEKIAVVVEIDNSVASGGDRRGQAAVTSVETLKYEIFSGLLNFNPSGLPRANQGLRYDGGTLLGFDRARLFWQFTFSLAATISETDGFQYTGVPLEQIDITVSGTVDGSTAPDIDVGITLST